MEDNRIFYLRSDTLADRASLAGFMSEAFGFPLEEADNLDSLADLLSEVLEETTFVISRQSLMEICGEDFSYRGLCMLADAVDENPCLHVRLIR